MGRALPWTPVTIVAFTVVVLATTTVVTGVDICTAYTDESGNFIVAFSCYALPYCCGNLTNKECCNDCSLAFGGSVCEEPWNPTSTIVQGVILLIAFILICTIGILAFNGSLDGKNNRPGARSGNSDFMPARPLPIDPEKGYPVQPPPPPINYEPGDNDVYPVQPGFDKILKQMQQQQGSSQEFGENDTLIVPEIEMNATVMDANLAKMAAQQTADINSAASSQPKMITATTRPPGLTVDSRTSKVRPPSPKVESV